MGEKSKKLKTKDHAVLVGLSLLLLLVNPSKLSTEEPSEISLNNNSLTVLDLMEIKDVTVVLWITVSLITKITVSVPNPPINIPPETEPVKLMPVPKMNSPSPVSPMLRLNLLMVLKPLVINNQFPLLLMLVLLGNSISEES